MKTFLKKILIIGTVLLSVASVTSFISPTPVHAVGGYSCRYMLGLTSWDCGISNFDSEDALVSNVIIIASNIFTDLTVIATYLTLGYVIYGGYLYIFAAGDAGKVAAGKKTLIHAFIGLAVVMLTNVILNALRIALMGNQSFAEDCVNESCIDPADLVTNVIQWIIGIAGVISTIFVIIGGIGYVTSAGDSAKLQKAKLTIFYALIGLAIVGLAEIATALVSNIIRDAEKSSFNHDIIIAKEIANEN